LSRNKPSPPSRESRKAASSFGRASLILLLSLLILGSCTSRTTPRPDKWAQPVASTAFRNLYRLDADVYRSEQPTRQGFEEALAKGIKSIVNLRAEHSDAALVEGLGFYLVEVPMTAGGFSEGDIVKALKAIQAAPKPVLVHCQYGADRAGVVLAMYRVVLKNWTREDALAEMTGGGFGFHWYYFNIPAFVKAADVARIREKLKAL
jgi:tyrosine-protein phosphatase SIW14